MVNTTVMGTLSIAGSLDGQRIAITGGTGFLGTAKRVVPRQQLKQVCPLLIGLGQVRRIAERRQ